MYWEQAVTRLDEHVDASPHVTALALELLDLLTSMHRPAGRDLTAAAHGEKAVMLHLYRTDAEFLQALAQHSANATIEYSIKVE